ncbi:NADP-dependent oxidoreductase [Kitasatospora sp. MMS16-BH015]|uniref:NADP-dependent oxidoreductase n=1 Tax=Kitasatospora sp. MMS16-BH015 TaxID=2018025 RepID=UPI000CF20740|nr:NADP-dependent oxidoreductase [Kitasatospora sp. MMS16-BH015]
MSKAYAFTAFGGPDGQAFVERPVPVPGVGELLVEVRAAGVNPVDWKVRRGLLGREVPLPHVFGGEVAGVVRGLGDGVAGFAVGDPVFGRPLAGGYAEHTLLAAGEAARVPDGVSAVQAAALPVAAGTAYDALAQLGLAAGETVLVLGVAGGVGSVAAQLARRAGLVVLGTASEGKRAYVESLGARAVAYGEDVAERVRAAAPGGVDGLLDLVGGDDLRAVAPLLRPPGRLVSTVDPVTAVELDGAFVRRTHGAETLVALAALVAAGELDPMVGQTYPLAEAGRALAEVEAGHARGKVVLLVPGGAE